MHLHPIKILGSQMDTICRSFPVNPRPDGGAPVNRHSKSPIDATRALIGRAVVAFERPCRKAIFTRSIFCMSLSGTAGPLRYRKHLLEPLWKCSINLPNHKSHSCASSDSLLFPHKSFSWFLLLKPCRLLIGLFWGAVGSFAVLFGVFYYIFLVKALVQLPKLTNCAR